MNIWEWVSAVFVAFGFVAWAVWGKFYQIHPAMLGIMSTSLLAFTVTLLSFSQFLGICEKLFPSLKSFAIMFFLCAVNGIAFYIYSAKVASQLIKIGDYIVVVSIFMLLEARFLDWYLNNNTMNIVNGAGLLIIILGIICFMR